MKSNVHTYKTRLIAKDFIQKHNIDYDKTFSLIAMLKSTKIMLAMATYYNFEI